MEVGRVFTQGKFWTFIRPDYREAFAFSIILYLHYFVPALRLAYLLQRRSGTGLPRSAWTTGWVRCCLYTGRSTSMCSHITYLHLVSLPFWPMCIINFHIFAHDGTSTAVQLVSPYHPSQFLSGCCYLSDNFVPAASHPNVAIDACTSRLLMMEHEVKSFIWKKV